MNITRFVSVFLYLYLPNIKILDRGSFSVSTQSDQIKPDKCQRPIYHQHLISQFITI